MKLRGLILPLFVSFFSLLPLAQARAQTTVVPGQSAGRIFLGMDRPDVWKVLGRPKTTFAVAYGKETFGEDNWPGGGHQLVVISERNKVVQVNFDSPRFTTAEGLSVRSTLDQTHRYHPTMTVQLYRLIADERDDRYIGPDGYYFDDVRQGIAFSLISELDMSPQDLEGVPNWMIIHRIGHPVVPIYNNHWSGSEPLSDIESLSRIRSWFTPTVLPQTGS